MFLKTKHLAALFDDDAIREQVRRKVLPYGKNHMLIDRLRHARGTVG
jgi:hypothetical protein